MTRIEHSMMVNRPIEEVSEYVHELRSGMKCDVRAKPGGNQEFSYRCDSGPIPEYGSFLLEPSEGGTRLTFVLELETGGLLGLVRPIIMPVARWQLRYKLAKLRNLIEAKA